MRKNTTSKNSENNGDQASITSDANTQAQSVSTTPTGPGPSLQTMEDGINLTDQPDVRATDNDKPLTPEEVQDLDRCEKVIEKGKANFRDTCLALDEIWSKRLYRAQYGSFKEYCQEKWGFSRAQGYRLLKASKTIKELSPMGDTANHTMNERQLRALAKAPAKERTKVLKHAEKTSGSANVTSGQIDEAVKATCEHTEPQAPAAPIQVTPRPVEKALALIEEFSGCGLPDFSGMSQMLDNITAMAAELEGQIDLKMEIAKLNGYIRHYAQFEGFRKAA